MWETTLNKSRRHPHFACDEKSFVIECVSWFISHPPRPRKERNRIGLPFVTGGSKGGMMYCTCAERNQWIPNERNLSSSSVTLPRKSQENLTTSVKKSALKSTTRPSTITPKKSVDIRSTPRYSTLPRSRARTGPHVATIFSNEQNHRPRRQSEVIPWHQQQPAQQCTCRSSCYFCNLNYPKVNYPLSASTNALGYYYPPYSTLSLNKPSSRHQSQYNLSSQHYLPHAQQQPAPTQHHHSMINLNHNQAAVPETSNLEPLVSDCPSPTMSNSPVPAPPVPPLNPACARCRFTSSISATSNGTIHRQPSNPHLHTSLSHQTSQQPSYGVPAAVGNAYTGESF